MAILNNSDVTSFEIKSADDHLKPYLNSTDLDNVEFAKRGYEGLLCDLQQGYYKPGLTRKDCEKMIQEAEKRIETLKK